MEKLGLNEIRERYLSFFESKGHLRMDSFPLVPQNDKTLLLINAGMAPLKPYFTGEQTPPAPRVTTCQKCIRTPDIDNVGKTARHGTYFEMLGNFSFGDYFKKEAASYAWEFVTKVLNMPVDRLWVSIYEEDDEALDIWTKDVGVDPSHVFRMGKKDNFWEIGTGYPCGPCSEIYFDRGEKYKCDNPNCAPGCDCDRYLEFWNLVFTQFNNEGDGKYSPLAKKNIDTGMGLERIAAIMQDVESLFDVDTMQDIMGHIVKISGVEYHKDPKSDISLRVITDHIRSTTMLISDGVIPSNEGRGYVLRRLLRRAVRHGKLIGIDRPFLTEVCDTVIKCNEKAYPQLVEKQEYIKKVMSMEEERFHMTLESGLSILDDMLAEMAKNGETVMNGDNAFKLYDTYGFPIDLTIEILSEKGLTVDEEGFAKAMQEQKTRAKKARADANIPGWEADGVSLKEIAATEFVGYEHHEYKSKVVAIIKENAFANEAVEGEDATVIVEATPFYGESGGQIGDTGVIFTDNCKLNVVDTKKSPDGKFLHICNVGNGMLSVNDEVTLQIDAKRRKAIMGAHSSVHLIHEALRRVLGTHVQQAGSLVEPNRIRFDFTHFSAVTPEELAKAEDIVNEQIREGLAVLNKEMPIAEAKEMGAMALFGEKYGNVVRVVKMGDFSIELCGGTHIDNIAKIGMFKITSESSVAAGVRRIEAVTGEGVMTYMREQANLIHAVADALKTTPADMHRRVTQIQSEMKDQQHKIEQLDSKISSMMAVDLFNYSKAAGALRVISVKIDNSTPDALRSLTDAIKSKASDAVCVLATVNAEGKINFAAACGKDAVKAGAHAGNILKEIAKMCGGGGGGRPDSAMAGGSKPEMLEAALESVNNIVEKQINK
ncbi:MAG: alanine--tRNA ligase [Ruminococcaceae bacterium]|nr:alanine--tRNA ligase [Oscillospiraceae bacterium]